MTSSSYPANRTFDSGPTSILLNWVLPLCCLLLLLASNYMVFMVVPSERVMGAAQRIFYFHVASAMSCYLCVAVLFFSSLAYLANGRSFWDQLAEASAGVALLFASIVLCSGMIWGHSAWNVWWRWEPRLVSFLVLWFLLLSYVSFRPLVEDEVKRRRLSSVLGLIIALNVPLVVFSIKLLSASEQLHPEVVADKGLKEASFVYALLLCTLALSAFAVWMMSLRFRQLSLASSILGLERSAGAPGYRLRQRGES